MVTFTFLNQSRASTNPRMMDHTVSVPSKEISSCYRKVLSAIWEMFSKFLIFCNLFFRQVKKYEKQGKYLPILYNIAGIVISKYRNQM